MSTYQPEPVERQNDCATCTEEVGQPNECPNAKRPCGHHCNCLWVHDACCWCDAHINQDGQLIGADGTVQPE